MYKYKRLAIKSFTIVFILLSIIELFIYLFSKNNIFGLFYIIANLFVVFLIVPTSYNYSKYYSGARLSKLIIVFILILFNSYLLELIILKQIWYIDQSKEYIDSIFVIKNVIKPVIDVGLLAFILMEFKLDKKIMNNTKKLLKK